MKFKYLKTKTSGEINLFHAVQVTFKTMKGLFEY
jgi:hypothetical protein